MSRRWFTVFTPLSQKIIDRLREADLNNLSHRSMMYLLNELKQQI